MYSWVGVTFSYLSFILFITPHDELFHWIKYHFDDIREHKLISEEIQGFHAQERKDHKSKYNAIGPYALKAEAYLQQLGVATAAYFGPESEFFLFDSVRYASGPSGSFFHIDSEEAFWNTGKEGQNLGYKVRNKGGYFPVQPTDSQMDIRNEMCTLMTGAGLAVERHHHEVATAGQGEINFRFDTLTRTADNLLLFKYIVRNVAAKHGKTYRRA